MQFPVRHFGRWPIALACVIVLGIAVLLPGLGTFGLWEPQERQLADISRNFQRIQREIREDLNLRRNEELAKVQERATRIINQIAEQEKFDLILQEAVFASGRIDITDKVIRALADR